MHTRSKPARPRTRAVIVALLIILGVLASVGVGYAAEAAPQGAGEGGTVCADGKRDDNPDDGVCTRDDGKTDPAKKDGGKKDGENQDAADKDGGGKGDGGTVCADGKRDDNPDDGVCTRDGGKGDPAGKDAAPRTDPNLVAGTPCTRTAAACADIGGKKAWLVKDGKVVRGPVPISSGGPGYDTPRGTFAVQWKSRDHRSAEFDNAPMPFSVFFTDGGIAFHQGDVNSNSHGCIHLSPADAEAFFNTLAVGDQVQVH
jgi:hypothetical protein